MSGIVVGKLYMNGCIHCDSLVEPWNQMEKKIGKMVEVIDIESRDLDTKLEKINAEFKTDVSVQGGFPTIFKIQNGKVEYYEGERTAPELIKWVLITFAIKRKSKKSHKINGGKKGKKGKKSKRNKK